MAEAAVLSLDCLSYRLWTCLFSHHNCISKFLVISVLIFIHLSTYLLPSLTLYPSYWFSLPGGTLADNTTSYSWAGREGNLIPDPEMPSFTPAQCHLFRPSLVWPLMSFSWPLPQAAPALQLKKKNFKGKGTSQGIQKNGLLEEMEVEKSRWKELSE